MKVIVIDFFQVTYIYFFLQLHRTSLIEVESTIAIYRLDSGAPFELSEHRTAYSRIREHAAAIRVGFGAYSEDAASQGSSQASTSYAAPSSSTGTAPRQYLNISRTVRA
jgi:hypothetical protein